MILLAKAKRVGLLTTLSEPLVVPEAVAKEVLAGPQDDPGRVWLESQAHRYVRKTDVVPSEIAAWDLGKGESAVLAWAYTHEGWTALIDDGAARRAARALGVSVSGTLGVVLAAKEEGAVRDVRPVMEALVQAGLRISKPLLRQVLRYAGESM